MPAGAGHVGVLVTETNVIAAWREQLAEQGEVVFRAAGSIPKMIATLAGIGLLVVLVGWQMVIGELPQLILSVLGWVLLLGIAALLIMRDRVTQVFHHLVVDEDGVSGEGFTALPWIAIAEAKAVSSSQGSHLQLRVTDRWLHDELADQAGVVKRAAKRRAVRQRLAVTTVPFPLAEPASEVAAFINAEIRARFYR